MKVRTDHETSDKSLGYPLADNTVTSVHMTHMTYTGIYRSKVEKKKIVAIVGKAIPI